MIKIEDGHITLNGISDDVIQEYLDIAVALRNHPDDCGVPEEKVKRYGEFLADQIKFAFLPLEEQRQILAQFGENEGEKYS